MRPRRDVCWQTALAVLGLLAAHAAHAEYQTWDAPSQVAAVGATPRLFHDPLGNLYMVWPLSTAGYWRFSIRPPGKSFVGPYSPPVSVGAKEIRIGFDAAGNALFAWLEDGSSLKSAYRTAGAYGSFGAVQSLGAARALDLSVNAAGDALLVWDPSYSSPEAVKVAFRPAGSESTFGTAEDLGISNVSSSFPVVVLDDDGAAAALWGDSFVPNPPSPYSQTLLVQATQPPGSDAPAFGAGVAVGATDGKQVKAQNASGRAVVAWTSFEDIGAGELGVDIAASVRESGGAFGALDLLADPLDYNADNPVATVGPGGHVGIGWLANATQETCAAGALKVAFSVAPPGGGFGAAVLRGGEETHANRPSIAFDPAGEPILVWRESMEDPCPAGIDPLEIRAEVGLEGGSAPISAFDDLSVDETAVARDANGNGYAVWESGSTPVLRGAFFDNALFRDGFASGDWSAWSPAAP